MYDFMKELLKDKRDGYIFKCFDIYHIVFLVILVSTIVILLSLFKNKSDSAKNKLINCSVGTAFGIYLAGFFLMPFAYGEISIEKLPFHACTLTCLLCFLSRYNKFLGKFKKSFTIIGFISNFVYAVYPAGITWWQVHPLSYRSVETLLFHGAMVAYAVFAISFDKDIVFDWKKLFKHDFVILVLMIIWALFGSYSYTGNYNGNIQYYNWFFVKTDPFEILPPYVAPFATLFAFLLADIVIHFIYFEIKKCLKSTAQSLES